MNRGHLAKSEATRERILESALALFAERGFAAATMRDVAERSECSLGLAYRYFRSKDAMALALYQRLLDDFAEEAARLEPGPIARRWGIVMRGDMNRLASHRATLTGLTAAGLSPGSATQVLGEEAAPVRRRMLAVFETLVAGATDLPRSTVTEALATLFYGLHLLLVFFWLQDPTPGQSATSQLIAFAEEQLSWLRIVLRIPGFQPALLRLAGILRPILDGEAVQG